MTLSSIYKKKPLYKTPLLFKLFNQPYKLNIMIEINNHLAKANKIKDVSLDIVDQLCKKYKTKLHLKYNDEKEKLFKLYLNQCLKDKQLSDEELEDLKYLKKILFLSDNNMDEIIKEECISIYEKEFNEIIADNQITDQEKEILEKLQNNLKIDDKITANIKINLSQKKYEEYLSKAIADKKLSPDEDGELNKIAANLGLHITLDNKNYSVLQKYRLYWTLENGDIPIINLSINLQKNENCYFMTPCNWYEYRSVTRRINYDGPTMRIRVVKGVYWRAGSLNVNSVKEDIMQLINTGTLFITNKRLIFMGKKGNKIIKLNKILNFKPYDNGIDIQKDTGKSPFIGFTKNIDIFSIILSRVIDEYN